MGFNGIGSYTDNILEQMSDACAEMEILRKCLNKMLEIFKQNRKE